MGLLDNAKDKARDIMDGDNQQDDTSADNTPRQDDNSMMDEIEEKRNML